MAAPPGGPNREARWLHRGLSAAAGYRARLRMWKFLFHAAQHASEGPQLSWRESSVTSRLSLVPTPDDPLGVTARLVGYNGQTAIHWGDGTAPTHMLPGRKYKHTYPSVGRYMVTVLDGAGVLIARQQIRVSGALTLEGVQVTEDDFGIRVSFGDVDPRAGGLPFYRIEWQDGDIEHAWGMPGHSVRHDAVPGAHEIKVVDTTSGRAMRFPVRVSSGPAFDPEFTTHVQSSDDSRMTVYIKLSDRLHRHPLHIWWDDADGPQLVEHPQPGMEIPHRYRYPGHYQQTVAYVGDRSYHRVKSTTMTVPVVDAGSWRDLPEAASRKIKDAIASSTRWQRLSGSGAGHYPALPALVSAVESDELTDDELADAPLIDAAERSELNERAERRTPDPEPYEPGDVPVNGDYGAESPGNSPPVIEG